MPLLGAPGTNDQLSVGDVQLFSWLKLMPSSNVVVAGTGLRILKMWEVRPEVPGGIGFGLGRRGVRRRLQQAGMAWAGSGSPGPGPEETLAQPPAPETTSRHLSARPDQGPASDRREWLHWTMGRRRLDHPVPRHRRLSQLLLICPPPAPVFGAPGQSTSIQFHNMCCPFIRADDAKGLVCFAPFALKWVDNDQKTSLSHAW